MNLKTKILDYFKEHWKAQIFLKSVCMVVSACLVLNILNLPAFASTEEDLRKKAFSSENKHQDVLYQKDTSFNTVSVMNSLEANIKIDKKTENIFVGKELKGFLSKEKDEQGRRKVMVRKGESFEEDPVLTTMVDNKLKGRKSSSGVETRQISQEQSPSVKEGESARQQKDKTSQEQQSKEAVKEESAQSQTPKEESVPKQQEAKGVQEETIEQEETPRQQEKPKQQSQPEQKSQTETATEGSSKRQEQTSDAQSASDVEKSSDTSKTVQELAESLQIDEKDRAKVIDEIARQTGLSKEEVEAELSKLDQTRQEGVIAALANLFGQGKDIVYCVADVLGTVLEATSKGLLAFEAILADAIAGIFVKNNQGLISGKSDQLMLSAQAIQTVLRKYGKEYVGIDTNIDDIIEGLDVGESAIVHVGGNHFITITKNEDGTFTKSDINKPAERLTEEELKVAIEREYGLKEDETTVLVKNDNDKFKGIKRVDNLSEVLGAERVWDNSQFEGKSQEQYYRDYGENSYEMLMKQMYGTTNLTPEQSREFAAFYEEFLKAAILDIDKTLSDEKASEEAKEKAKALKSQAAKELAIIEATLEVLRENPDGVVSGQIGQVLLREHRAYPNQNQDIPDGEYYQVITIYADDLKEQHSITGSDGKAVSIESYRISKGSSISTREGVTVTRSDGSTYQVFGIGGKFEGMDVAYEYIVAYKADGTFYMDENANIYLLNDTDRVYQARKESGSRPPTSGQYKGAAPERENWTHAKIIETETGYIICGAGSRISAKKTSRGWEVNAIGIGTEAMRGSVLRISANDPNGVAATIFLDIKEGFMVYAGNYWVPSDGFVWKFNEGVSDEQIEQFLKNTITTQLGSNADGIENIEFIGSDGLSLFKDLTFEQWLATLDKKTRKWYETNWDYNYGYGGKNRGQREYKAYLNRFKKYKDKNMLGAPFSTAAIFKSMGISAKIHTKAGFTYDGTKSDGDIYKLTIDSSTVLKLEVKDDDLVIVATENIIVHATITEGDWALEMGGTTLTDTIKKGQVFSFATMLNNTGRQIVNTREIEIITGYEITGQDDKGNNYYDYSKPKYSKMKAGTFKVGGNSKGKYVLINNLYISISNGNWDVMDDQSGSQYDSTGENCAYWHAGAEITISKKGKTFDISITKGALTVKNLTVTLYHKMNDSSGGGDGGDDKYEGPTIDGAYITDYKDLGNNMYSYKINSGTFKGVSGDQVTQNSLGNFLFVPGSDFKKGSIIQPDATRAKYDSKIKKDGSIDAYGAKWYEKMWDGIVGFFSILAFSLMTIFTLGATMWAKDMKGMQWTKEWAAITYGYWNHVEADGSNEEAVKRGMDLGIAGLAAVAILVVTAISLAVSIFTGGASVAAAIAAVAAIAGAVASSVSAINLTYSAIQAFRAGKGGQGALMLFFALLTVVLACVGAGQMGNTIASGLVTLGKQFFIKMAIGAVIGAVAGAGIAAISYGIRYGIDKSKGHSDDFDWGEFGKEVGIGALTGAFAGAAAGAQVASAVAKNVAKGVAQQAAKGVSGEVAKEVGEEVGKDVSKEISKQVSKEVAKEMAKTVSKDAAKQAGAKVAESIAKEISADITEQITQSLTKAVSVEVGEEVAESVAKEVGKEVAKNVVDDLATSVAKSVETQIVEGLSGQVSKEVAENIAKNVAEKIAKSISSAISQDLAKNVASMTAGQIAKEMILGGTSFTRQAGQTTLQFVGTFAKSVLTVIGRVGMQALNGYMTYMSAKSFVDSIESGDFLGAVKAMYTLISIDIIMPVMSAHSAIKEGGSLKGADLAKEGSAELSSSAKGAEKVASEGMRIQGMSVGWKVGSVAITTVVGAGVGIGIAAIIDVVSGKKIRAKDLIIGGTVGGTIGLGFGALATKADWTLLGNSVKTSIAKTLAPFGGKTAQLVRGADGGIVVKELSEFSGATMLRAWGGLVGGGGIGVAVGVGIWAAKGRKKEEMARYLIIGGAAGGVLGAGIANAWSSGAYKGVWQNYKADPGGVFRQVKEYVQESLVKTLMMVQDINIFNTYMAYSTGILNQIYNKITGGSLANTDIVKFINKVTGMTLFKSQGDLEEDREYEKRKKEAEEKGEEFKEEGVVYKGSFGDAEAKAVIEQNWGSLTNPTMYAGNVVGGFLKPVLGAALQHSPILGSVMNVMESASSASMMQKYKIVSMFYNMGVKMRVLNIISKEVFDDPNNPDDDQLAGLMGFAFMQMFESIPPQAQAEAVEFLASSQKITKTVDGKQVTVELGAELYSSATLLKNSISEEKFKANLETVCSNLGLPYDVVNQDVTFTKNFNQIVDSLLTDYIINGLKLGGSSQIQLLSIREDLKKIVEISPIMKQGAGLSSFDIINSISSKLNYLDACAKILELNVEGITAESIASGTLSKEEYTKILQAQDDKQIASGVRVLMNYLSGISSVSNLPINDLISSIVDYRQSLYAKLFDLKAQVGEKNADIDTAKTKLGEAEQKVVQAKKDLSQTEVELAKVIETQENILGIKQKMSELESDIKKYESDIETAESSSVRELQKNLESAKEQLSKMTEELNKLNDIAKPEDIKKANDNIFSKKTELAKVESEQLQTNEMKVVREYVNAFENTYSPGAKIVTNYMIATLVTSLIASHDPSTAQLKKSLSSQSFREGSYLAYTTFRDNPAIKDALEIESLRKINESGRTEEQKGQLALLEAKYLPLEIVFNSVLNTRLNDVASGKLSYEEFSLVIGASDALYSRVTTAEERGKLAGYRKDITVAAVNMGNEVIQTTKQMQVEGKITKAQAAEILNSIRSTSEFTFGEAGNVSSLMYASASARSMLSSIRSSDIVPVVTADGRFLTFNTAPGNDVLAVNGVKNTEKGMKVNLSANGQNIGDVIFRNNLDAITNNKVISQAIAEKYPNMIASELALNAAVKVALKSLSELNLSESQINQVIEVALKGASGANNKLTAQSQKAIQDIVGSKEVANLVIRSIENRLDLKVKLENVLSTSDALVFQTGTFRVSSDGKQIENKGYTLSSSAKNEIVKLLGVGDAETVIKSVESTLNTERIVNDVKAFKSDPSQLIKLCSANVNPTAISVLFSHLGTDISASDDQIKMSLADLAILCEQAQNAIVPQLKAMINNAMAEAKIVEQLSKYLKDSGQAKAIFDQVKAEVLKDKDVKDSQLYKIVNQHLDLTKIVSTVIEDIDSMKGKSEDEIVDSPNLKSVFANSGYPNPDALLPRLKLLTEEIAGKTRLETVQEKFYNKDGYLDQAKTFISESTVEVGGKTMLKPGTIDKLRAKAMAMSGEDAINFLRITLNECMREAVGFGMRGAQSELTTTLQNDINAALGMGAGKTVSLALDAAMQRVLMGNALNLEILVGNSDLANYVSETSSARKFLEFIGMKAVSITDFKAEGGDTNIAKLKEAYQDPNTVIIMDPTIRGHMMNEAVSRGGESGRELREILQSVNRVTVDEVHLWALTRTAAVIGEDNKPPDSGILNKAVEIADIINAKNIYKEMIKGSKPKATIITIEGKEVLVRRFANSEEFNKASISGEYIAIIGEQTASLDIKMSNGIRDILLNKIGSAPEGYSPSGILNSMIRGLFAASDNGGMALGSDGKVKPVGVTGIQENMVISDIYLQLGFALRDGLDKEKVDLKTYMANSTQMSNTSMQTSLAAIYSGASARMVGISGTVAGLQQLIINRTGSVKIYNITGESVDPSMFNGVMTIDPSKPKENPLADKLTDTLEKIKAGSLPKEALDNVLLLGKTQATLESFRSALKGAIEKVGGFAELNKMGIEVFEFTDKQGKWTQISAEGEVTVSGDLGSNMKTISDVAKNKNIKRIILANEMGATGVDYQGNFLNVIADAHLMSNTDLAQALKRTSRPNESFNKEGGLQRWTTERVIMYEQEKVEAELKAFAENPVFVEYARDLWSGKVANGNMVDSKSIEWLNVIEKENFDLKNSKVVEGLYKLSSEYGKVQYTSEQIKEIAMKEAITFISKVQDLRGVDASIRFAINDAIRDRMVLSVLRNVVASLPEGKAKEAAQAELNDALKNKSFVSKDIFEVKGKMKAESGEEVMRKAFERSMEEAEQRFGRLQEVLKRLGSDVKITNQVEVIENHLESIRIAMSNEVYYNSKPIRDKGLSDAIDMTEFMQIIHSFEEYIMPMATVLDRGETISTERSIQDITSKAVTDYVKNDNTLSKVNEKGERVLTAKGELFVKMMQAELAKESNAMVGYLWLANKFGSQYKEVSKDINVEEQMKGRIENIRNLVDKLTEKNKDMRYEVVKELFVLQKDEEFRGKEYSIEEIEQTVKKVNEKYMEKVEKLRRFKGELEEYSEKNESNKERIEELDKKLGSLEEEIENHMPKFNEMGIDEVEYELIGELKIIREEKEGLLKKEEVLQRMQKEYEEQLNQLKEAGYSEEDGGRLVEGSIVSEWQKRVQEALDKDSSLSKEDKDGERVLTQKGKIYAKVAKELVEENKNYARFLMEGPLGKLGFGDKIKANMESNKREIKYEEELVKGITEALWEANIWEYAKVEKMYGFYGLVPKSERAVLDNISIGELKGILNAQHSNAVKGIAEQRGYKLPDAEVVALARLTKGMKFERENERIGKYFGNIVKKYEELEKRVQGSIKINNSISETSMAVSRSPRLVKKALAGIRGVWQYVGVGGTRWKLSAVSESVDISIEEAIEIVGIDREKVSGLVNYAVEVGSQTQEGLDNFDSLVKNSPRDQVSKLFESHVNVKKVIVTVGLIMGGIGIVGGMCALLVFVGPLVGLVGIVGAVGMGAVSGLGVIGALGVLGSKFNILKKIMPEGDYFKKLKISDMDKFAKLKVFTELIRREKIDLRKEEDMEKVSAKSLYKAVNASKPYMQEISDEEGRLILGEGGLWTTKGSYDIIKENKKNIIEEKIKALMKDGKFREENKQNEGESPRAYEERLKKLAKSEKELGFRWSIGLVKSIIESGGYAEDKEEQEKVLAVLIGDASVKTEDIVSRYKQVSEMVDIIDERVDIKVLQEYGMFKEDNSVSKEFISKYVRPELIMRVVEKKLEDIGYKEGKEGEAKAGEKLVGRMGEGYSKGEELNRAIVQVLALFEDVEEMEEYLGLEVRKEHTKEEIGEGAFRTYKKALELFAKGEIGKEGLRQETEIIRTVSEMLMIGVEKPELIEAINKERIDAETLKDIERMVNIESTKVNKYVFIEELRKEVKESRGKEEVFDIKIEDLKKGLERKEEKEEMLSKGISDLLPLLERGERGKRYNTALTMEIRNARAVSQAA